jgi:hypothetical protein
MLCDELVSLSRQARVPDWRDRIVAARPLQLLNVHRLDRHGPSRSKYQIGRVT